MTDICREVRRHLKAGNTLSADLEHIDSCQACEMWLQEHVNFRSLLLSAPAALEHRLMPPRCDNTLRDYCDNDNLKDAGASPCLVCRETIEGMENLSSYLGIVREPSQTLLHRLIRIPRPRVSPILRLMQIAAALILATLITLALYPTPTTRFESDRGKIHRKIAIEMAVVKATFYKYYGEARGRLATTLAQAGSDKEENNEMPVSSE